MWIFELLDKGLSVILLVVIVAPLAAVAIVTCTRWFRIRLTQSWNRWLGVQIDETEFRGASRRLVVPVRAFFVTIAIAMALVLLSSSQAPYRNEYWYNWISSSGPGLATLLALLIGSGFAVAIAHGWHGTASDATEHANPALIPKWISIPVAAFAALAIAVFAVVLTAEATGALPTLISVGTSPAVIHLVVGLIAAMAVLFGRPYVIGKPTTDAGEVWDAMSRTSVVWVIACVSLFALASSVGQSLHLAEDALRENYLGTLAFDVTIGAGLAFTAFTTMATYLTAIVGIQLAHLFTLKHQFPAIYAVHLTQRKSPLISPGVAPIRTDAEQSNVR